MEFGVGVFPTDENPDPATLARMAEERGFAFLLFPEHTHIPASRETPYPGGGDLPRQYYRTYDPFVALMAAAAATERLRVGTGICLVPQRDPIVTAKCVASVDRLSGGRMIFGIGAGWNVDEMRNHGTEPGLRFSIMRERVEAMKALWTEDEATYHGRHVDFERVFCWPKPVQQPHPPVWVGGNGPKVIHRVVAYGDAWLPNRIGSPEELGQRVGELERAASEAGRETPPVILAGASREPRKLDAWMRAGLSGAMYWIGHGDAAETERRFEACAAAMQAYARG